MTLRVNLCHRSYVICQLSDGWNAARYQRSAQEVLWNNVWILQFQAETIMAYHGILATRNTAVSCSVHVRLLKPSINIYKSITQILTTSIIHHPSGLKIFKMVSAWSRTPRLVIQVFFHCEFTMEDVILWNETCHWSKTPDMFRRSRWRQKPLS